MAVDEPEVLAAGTFLRRMLEMTLGMWRGALLDDMTLAGAVITVVVDLEGFGPLNVCVSHPMDEPEAIKRIATQTAEMLSKAL